MHTPVLEGKRWNQSFPTIFPLPLSATFTSHQCYSSCSLTSSYSSSLHLLNTHIFVLIAPPPFISDTHSTSLLCHPPFPQFLSTTSTFLTYLHPSNVILIPCTSIFISPSAPTNFLPTPTPLALSLHFQCTSLHSLYFNQFVTALDGKCE